MASLRRRDHGRTTSVVEAPHFIKIIVVDTEEIEKLKIPTKFVEMHGNELSKTLCLKVPNGGVWKVDVVNIDGEVWLQNGWKEFAEYYSLSYASLLVFRYEGNSNFWVLIFDKTASEIDYPLHSIPAEEPNNQISDEPLPHTSSRKRRINSTGDTEKGPNLLLSDSHFPTTDTKSNILKLGKSRIDMGDSTQENGGIHRQLHPEVPAKNKTSSPCEKSRALLKKAEAFQPKNPSFRIIVQPSHISESKVSVPPEFVERFLTQKKGNVTLSVSDERTWSAIYVCHMNKKGTYETFLCGWTAFVEDNRVKAGDVCVFELINSKKVSLKVVIFRNTGDANSPMSLDKRSIGVRVRKRKMEPNAEPIEIPTDSSDEFEPSQRQEGQVKSNPLMPKDKSIRREPSSSRVVKAPEPAGQNNLSFKVVMFRSYLQGKTMNVPWDFAKELKSKRAVTVRLKVADKLWPVNLHSYEDRKCSKMSGGFGVFLGENSIQVGDECVFELIDKDRYILNVTILRCSRKWL